MSSGPETCLLQVARDPTNNHVIDISGNSGYNSALPSGITWENDSTYGEYLNFDDQKIQITNTNGNNDPRTVLMFFNQTDNTSNNQMIFGFDEYTTMIYKTEIGYTSNSNNYSPSLTPAENTWYHLGAVITGNGNMVGNKMYINGINEPLSWTLGSANGKAIFENYIVLGGYTQEDDHKFYGYESQIYYFDREL